MSKQKFHFGGWLRSQVEAQGDVVEFCERVPVSKDTLYRWMREPSPNIRGKMRAKLASALKLDRATIEILLRSASEGIDSDRAQAVGEFVGVMSKEVEKVALANRQAGWEAAEQAARILTGAQNMSELAKLNITSEHARKSYFGVPAIPCFDRDLAAGPWTEPIGSDDSVADDYLPAPPIPVGRNMNKVFAVRLYGHSMEPKYPSESYVYFYRIAPRLQIPAIGCDYYLQRSDGTATFKKVVGYRNAGKTMRLRAINQDLIPGHMDVEYDEIVNAAEAIGVYCDKEWSKHIDLDEENWQKREG